MTTNQSPVDVGTFAIAFFEGAHRTALQAMDGLSDDQLFQQPTGDTNSIGWLAWHMSRWKDQFAAQGLGEEQVWVTGGWPEKFGVEPERTGQGDSLEQVAAFRPARDVLVGYVEAAQASTLERIVPNAVGGSAKLTHEPDGVHYVLRVPDSQFEIIDAPAGQPA